MESQVPVTDKVLGTLQLNTKTFKEYVLFTLLNKMSWNNILSVEKTISA